MPKFRQLHLKILDSFDVAEMPDDFTRLLWVFLMLIVDSAGRGLDDPSWLRSKLFPLRSDVTLEQISGAMEWLGNRGMIQRYSAENRRYFCIIKWLEYQSGTEKEAKSSRPKPPELPTYSRPTPDLLPTNSASIQYNTIQDNADSAMQTNSELSAPLDPFDQMQQMIEEVTGMPPDSSAPKVINELLEMKALREDLQAGYKWYREQGKTFKYYSSLVGPTRVALARRIGAKTPTDHKMTEEELIRGIHV